MPAICVGIASSNSGGGSFASLTPWQSGQTETYVALYVAGRPLIIFIPFFLFSMVGLTAVIFRGAFRNQNWTKGAIYSGVLLSSIYFVLFCITHSLASIIAALIAGPLLALVVWLASILFRQWKNRISITYLMIATAVVAVAMALILRMDQPFYSLMGFPLVAFWVLVIACPTLNCVTYWRLAAAIMTEDFARVEQSRKPSGRMLLSWLVAAGSWITAYWLSVRQAIEWTLEEYQKLPTTQPDCYVCSAAANGHAKWVGSNRIKTPQGLVIVNLQMQRLKALELMATVICPRALRPIRAVYDLFGPTIARRCASNRWCADITFLLLKPVEWLAVVVAWGVGISAASISRLYRR